MSQHSKNTDVKESPLDPDMENEAEQIATSLVSETLDRAAGNINELMQSICRWENEEHSKSAADGNKDESFVACRTNQKVERELLRFFNMRRVFAEHRGEEVTEEDLMAEMDATPGTSTIQPESSESDSGNEKQTGRYTRMLYKKMKSAGKSVKKLFRKKSRNKGHSVPDQHEEEAAESSSQSSSHPQEASSLTSVHSNDDIRTATNEDLNTVPLELVNVDNEDEDVAPEEVMEEDLVADMDATPGTSQVQQEAEHADEVVGSATSDSPSKEIETKPGEMSPTASASSSEDISGTVDADGTQTCIESDSKNERRAGRYTRIVYKKMKSAGKSVKKLFRKKSRNKGHSVPDQHEEEAAESSSQSSSHPQEASSLTSVRSNDDIRTATNTDLSTVPLELVNVDNEDEDVAPEEVMEEDLVTDMDATPGTSQVQQEAEHADEVVGSATSDSPSKDIETKPGEMSPTASASSSEDISGTVDADGTQTCIESDSKNERQAGRYTRIVYKKMKSAGKSVKKLFRKKRGNKVQPAPDQHEEEATESSSQSSSPLQEASSLTLVCSSDDIRTATKSDLSTVPLEVVGEDEDVAPEEFMEEDPVKDMDATPGPSQTKPSEISPTPSTSSSEDISDTPEADRKQTSIKSDSKNERRTGRRTSVVKKKRKFAYFFFRKKNKVHPVPDQHEEEAAASGSQNTPSSSPPQIASTPTSVHSTEDMKAAIKAELIPVPVEPVDVDDEDVTPKEKEDVVSEPSTISSSPTAEHCEEMSSVTEEDLVTSQEGSGAAAQLTGLKNTFYYIIKEFFNSLTERQLEEIKRGVYNTDVKEQMTDMCMEVLKLVIEAITNTLSQAINPSAPQYGTMRSPTCSQECSIEQFGQNLPSKLLRESFDINDDDIQKSVNSSFGEALCDVLSSDSTIEVSPKITKFIVKTVTDELNSILSQTIQASLDGGSSTVSTATCCQFSSCRKCKEMLNRICQTPCKGKKKKEMIPDSTYTARSKNPSLLKRIRMFCCRPSCCSSTDVLE